MTNQTKLIRTYPERYLRCKYFRTHAFFITGRKAEDYEGRPRSVVGIVAECSSCGTRRTDWKWRNTGELEKRWYELPDDYRLDLDVGERLDSSVVHTEMIRRVTALRTTKKGG